MPDNEIPEFVRTLIVCGFDVVNVDRKPNFTTATAVRYDEFGMRNTYLIAYAGGGAISTGDAQALVKLAKEIHSALVVVSDAASTSKEFVVLSRAAFFGKLGGRVSSTLALEPEYGSRLVELGFNRLPPELKGRADDLFEAYVHSGLQFLLRGRVVRYGQERRFEAVSDGVITGKETPLMLYDCKAAGDGYDTTKNTVRQFADYVNDYHHRYEQYLGRLHAFVAVSSAFQSPSTLLDRSNELYSACSIPLVCVTAETLAEMVTLFSQNTTLRGVVDWKDIFRPPLVSIDRVQAAIESRRRDRIVRE